MERKKMRFKTFLFFKTFLRKHQTDIKGIYLRFEHTSQFSQDYPIAYIKDFSYLCKQICAMRKK